MPFSEVIEEIFILSFFDRFLTMTELQEKRCFERVGRNEEFVLLKRTTTSLVGERLSMNWGYSMCEYASLMLSVSRRSMSRE